MNLQKRLFDLQDPGYRAFQSKLIPTVDPERVIGVRVPELRKLAKSMEREEAAFFLKQLPHAYYEEDCLHGFLIERIKDPKVCLEELDRFLPWVDNWATCDMTSPKCLKNDLPALLRQIPIWMASDHAYTVRFGLLCLMRHFLGEQFSPVYLDWAAELQSEEYYVNMMVAWFFAEALVKQYDAAIEYLENNRLPIWTHNKAVQKARESYRITKEQKEYLKTLKRLP